MIVPNSPEHPILLIGGQRSKWLIPDWFLILVGKQPDGDLTFSFLAESSSKYIKYKARQVLKTL